MSHQAGAGRPADRAHHDEPGTAEARRARLAVRAFGLALIALSVANCSSPQVAGKQGNKYGVKASPRVIAGGQPVPKGGGRDMTGKPYVVGGRTYTPHAGPGYDREGWASWYGAAFHGRLTANGEVFDRGSIAAAHPTLPLPSYVRVTNAVNKRSMIVRVNDRGPYEHDRVIDVSEQVADALGFKRGGISRVRVQYVGRASVNGSDDEKLLATLRMDGSSAPSGGLRGQTMLASLRDDDRPARREPRVAEPAAPIKIARLEAEDVDPPVRRVLPARAPATVAEPEPSTLSLRPPQRPSGMRAPVRQTLALDDDAEDLPPVLARPRKSAERADFAEIYFADPGPSRRRAIEGPFSKLKAGPIKPLRAGSAP